MLEIGVFEAKNKLSALLDEVGRGGEVTITRHGKPVARLVAPLAVDRSAALAAARRIVERSKGVTLGDVGLKGLVDEGRR